MKAQQGTGYFLPSWVMPDDGSAIDTVKLGALLWAIYSGETDNDLDIDDVMRLVGMRWLDDEYKMPDWECTCGEEYKANSTELRDDIFQTGVQARYRVWRCKNGHTVSQRMTSPERWTYEKTTQEAQG